MEVAGPSAQLVLWKALSGKELDKFILYLNNSLLIAMDSQIMVAEVEDHRLLCFISRCGIHLCKNPNIHTLVVKVLVGITELKVLEA